MILKQERSLGGKIKLFFPTLIFLLVIPDYGYCQGYNHTFLIGYAASNNVARLNFDSNSISVIPEVREMEFLETQANFSDANGNFLISSNGCWVANANNDTMMNGSGLNPNTFTSSWFSSGLPLSHGNLIIPFPGDSTKFVLFHQTGDFNMPNVVPSKLYYSVIDMTLDTGLGGIISNQKNLIAFQDTLSVGLAACKHSNGRDWWIIAIKDASNIIFKVLFTPSGISSITSQSFSFPLPYSGNSGQPTFSPDGTKFAYTSGNTGPSPYHDVRLFHFDRCTGVLIDSVLIPFSDGTTGFGLAFSSNSKYLYHSSFTKIFQINVDTTDIIASIDTVAFYDGFMSGFPPTCCATNFWLMYLAANGKIYISSGNGVIDMHFINYPDSADMACDVHQHDLPLSCFSVGANVNHPNYYLGCDTTGGCPCFTSIDEIRKHDFRFSISPNPTSGNIKIIYLLPQNKSGVFEMFDVNGRRVFTLNLPHWSTLQMINLPELSDGLYQCVITSGNKRVSKKMAVVND